MADAWTYETAAVFWRRTRANPEGAWTEFEAAERHLLDHAPRTVEEAAQVMAVLVEQGAERRSDGRDVEAIGRVRRFLVRLAKLEAPENLLALQEVA